MIVSASSVSPSVIVGVDPGETTGVCVLELASSGRGVSGRIANGRSWGHEFPVDYSSGVGWLRAEARFVREMRDRLVRFRSAPQLSPSSSTVVAIVMEDFILREHNKGRSLLSPVRIISGLCSLLEEESQCWSVELQSASDAKAAVTDATLKSLGLYWVGMQHARDATRHAVLYARKFG